MVNKDRPVTWVSYKESLCRSCRATCCTMPVEVKIEDLVRLGFVTQDEIHGSRGKLVSRLKKAGVIVSYRESTGKFMIASRPNGDCRFLDERTRLCTVYDNRPQMCRDFPTAVGNRLGHCPYMKQ